MNRPKPRGRRPFPGQCVKVSARNGRCSGRAHEHGLCKPHLREARRLHEGFLLEVAEAREAGAPRLLARWYHTGAPTVVRLKP